MTQAWNLLQVGNSLQIYMSVFLFFFLNQDFFQTLLTLKIPVDIHHRLQSLEILLYKNERLYQHFEIMDHHDLLYS